MTFDFFFFLVENLSKNFKSLYNPTRVTVTLHEDVFTFVTVTCWILLRIRNVSGKVVEKLKTHILCSITVFRKSCPLWDNVNSYCGSKQATDNIIRRMRFACWITKAKHTHSEHVILVAFPRQQWFRERTSMLRHTCIVYIVISSPFIRWISVTYFWIPFFTNVETSGTNCVYNITLYHFY
jgi:hypothetical protein